MTVLTSTSDIIRVVTGSAVTTITVQASYVDLSSGSYTPASTETAITTATTTTIIAAPGASTYRRVKGITITNNSTTADSVVTVQKFNGTLAADLMKVTLLRGETLSYLDGGGWSHHAAFDAPYEYTRPNVPFLGISGSKAQTIPRELFEANISGGASGALYLNGVWIAAGTVVNSISFFSGTTAAGTPTNQIFGLYSKRWGLLGQTSNDTTTAWAANTIKTLNLSSAYTIPSSDLYYLGCMVTATTVPTYKGVTNGTTLNTMQFMLGGNSSTGLTTALPNPCAALTGGNAARLWACVS